MRHGDHPRFLGVLREQVIAFLQSEIEKLRNAEFSGRPPATSSPRDYQNSLRLDDHRFIIINRPTDAAPNSALHVCLGRDRTIVHQPEQGQWLDWNPSEEAWGALAAELAPWVARELLDLALNKAQFNP